MKDLKKFWSRRLTIQVESRAKADKRQGTAQQKRKGGLTKDIGSIERE